MENNGMSKRVDEFRIIDKTENIFDLEGEYVIPERDMNLFISLNGGIDEYLTISAPYYMWSDMMNAMKNYGF